MEEERPEFVKAGKDWRHSGGWKEFWLRIIQRTCPPRLEGCGNFVHHRQKLCPNLLSQWIQPGSSLLESAEAAETIQEGDQVRVDLATGEIENLTQEKKFRAKPIPAFMQELIDDGGLVPHLGKKELKEKLTKRCRQGLDLDNGFAGSKLRLLPDSDLSL